MAKRQIVCQCATCGSRANFTFPSDTCPQYGEHFPHYCTTCACEREHVLVLTRKIATEIRVAEQERQLHDSILALCTHYGFICRFVYQSVLITTPVCNWFFDYHRPRKTLYHESTIKVNFVTGDYAKSHKQFKSEK